jgi:chorismate mutase
MVRANGVKADDVAAAIFSLTPDLNAEFPAIAARRMGWSDVPLMCATELDIPKSMKKVVRILLLVNSSVPPGRIRHQYLGKTPTLRPDLARKPSR